MIFSKTVNALEGSIWDKIIVFAIPMALTSLFQQLFNSADIAVIGRFSGSQALAAVGSTATIVNIFINCLVGTSVGATVVISHLLGENNEKAAQEALHASVCFSVIFGIILGILGLLIAQPVLRFMGTPAEVLDMADLYLKIYYLGIPFLTVYNFGAAIFRANGDTKKALFALTVSGFINVALNIFFVVFCGMNVDGVAIATVIANIISAGLIIYHLTKEQGLLHLSFCKIHWHTGLILQVLKIGIPTAIQGMVFSLSNMIIQVAINSLGSAAIAASTVALNFEMWAYHVLTGFSQACTAFVGLNYGARKLKRCIRITRWCMLEGIIASIFVSLFFVLLRKPLVALFTADSVIAEWAYVRICWIISFEFISMVMDVFSGALRGWGFSLLPAVITTAGICVLRVIYVYTVFAGWPDFGVLMAVYPLSWLVTAIGITIAYFTVKKKIIATQMGAWAEQDY